MYRHIKQSVFRVIQPAQGYDLPSKIFDCAIMFLIALSIIGIFLVTFDLPPRISKCVEILEVWSIVIFTAEYLLRIWTADLLYPQLSPWKARLKYVVSGMAIIDLLAILPFYLPRILPIKLLGLRVFRLVRVQRLFKLQRYSDSLNSITSVFKSKARDIATSFFVVLLLLTVSSLFIYYAEHDAQPENFRNAFSGLWWAVATLTTVGYGDIYPITPLGRFLGAIIAILGIGVVAVPTSILSAGFMETLNKQIAEAEEAEKAKDEKQNAKAADGGHDHTAASADSKFEQPQYCPHCGKKLFP